jgi:hypothetical protein
MPNSQLSIYSMSNSLTNTLRNIAQYGSEYQSIVQNPVSVDIQQSRPFCMRFPQHQATFFRLFTKLLFYLVSGYSSVGYLTADEYNPYYQSYIGCEVRSLREIKLIFRQA